MTDAKPVEVGEIVKQLDALTGYFSGVGMDGEEIHSPIAKSRTALLALQAEVARLTQENTRLANQAGAVAFNLGRARAATTQAESDHWVREATRLCEQGGPPR